LDTICTAVVQNIAGERNKQHRLRGEQCARRQNGLHTAKRIIVDSPTGKIDWACAQIDDLNPFASTGRAWQKLVDQHR
jgi:hypothetical protein